IEAIVVTVASSVMLLLAEWSPALISHVSASAMVKMNCAVVNAWMCRAALITVAHVSRHATKIRTVLLLLACVMHPSFPRCFRLSLMLVQKLSS
ncbi:MAG: hypothetical protein ACO3JL_16505, partial [Myxococcota bacterium]